MSMEQICPNCGATNRSTSRYCARCGHSLPGGEAQDAQKSEGSLELPWLQAVQDKAVQSTSSLGPEATGTTGTTGTTGAASTTDVAEQPQSQGSDAEAQAQVPPQ